MDAATLLRGLTRRWWLVLAVAALAALGAALAVGGRADRHANTVHFVLRPDTSVSKSTLPGALDALKSDAPLVQTVVGILDSDRIVGLSAGNAGLPRNGGYTIESTVRPGSALIDSTLTAPDAASVDRLTAGFSRVAPSYVALSYPAYALDSVGVDRGGEGPALGAAQVVFLALLLGALLGVALVAAELRLERRRLPASELPAAPAPATDAYCIATTSRGTPCRNRPVEGRRYCHMHLPGVGVERARANGAGGALPVVEPATRATGADGQRSQRANGEGEG